MLRKRRVRSACFILIMMMFLLEICGDTLKTDSLFAYSYTEKEDAITTKAVSVVEPTLCTTDMIRGNSANFVQRLNGRYIGQKKDVKISMDLLGLDIYLPEPGKDVDVYEPALLSFAGTDETMVNYVHKADGKKRA